MLITFTVKDQKITHDLKQTLVSGSVGIVQAVFQFDASWDDLDKIVVFKNSKSCKPIPVRYRDRVFNIPADVLLPGKLYVSCVGFGSHGVRKNTQGWDIQQAITVSQCGDMGGCDLLRNIVQVPEAKVATDEEFSAMMKDVFGEDYGSTGDPDNPDIGNNEIATDEEVQEMFAEVFGAKGHGS